ncbi:hypothetical protein [Gottfriedia acidiceleris]|uniref:hypothetical protein n=1 Tax=Gottfriedia acidiceleris TaxID=371036 RepID=UPI00101D6AE2|nr:hypothetical protein [Gottfriedia acidiceleris]
MNKNLLAFSIIFLGICIVLSSWLISNELGKQNRYEFSKVSDNYNMIFDKKNGDYWTNLDDMGWEKHPFVSPKKN